MNLQVNVYGSPWSTNSAINAQSYIQEALQLGHEIKRVFFFFDGVFHGLTTQSPATDEFNLLDGWKTIHEQGVDLFLCIAAAANRGVLNESESVQHDHSIITCDEIFEVTGLGQWASGFHDTDRIVSFK